MRLAYGHSTPRSPFTPPPYNRLSEESIHVGVPAGADVIHHARQSLQFLHRVVWRCVLGDKDKVLHSYKTGGEEEGVEGKRKEEERDGEGRRA